MVAPSPVLIGDPAPWFTQRGTTPSGSYSFDMSAGRHVALFFFHSASEPAVRDALAKIRDAGVFDGKTALLFGVSADPADEANPALTPEAGRRFLWDCDGKVAGLFGRDSGFVVLDPMLRVRAVAPFEPEAVDWLIGLLPRLPSPLAVATQRPVPALVLDDVFEPGFCRQLIAYYHAAGSTPSAVFTQDDAGRSVAVADYGFKRRRDCRIVDRALVAQTQARIVRRVVPEIARAFQFHATRLDRLILSCYDAADRGCFGAHRDNTVPASAHRRFAVSINLNDDFDGGALGFPEFGGALFRPPAGGALVFSCSLMHAVTPVTRGQRFACLPFVYDDAAETLKLANRAAARAERDAAPPAAH